MTGRYEQIMILLCSDLSESVLDRSTLSVVFVWHSLLVHESGQSFDRLSGKNNLFFSSTPEPLLASYPSVLNNSGTHTCCPFSSVLPAMVPPVCQAFHTPLYPLLPTNQSYFVASSRSKH
ncbi:hypothetical protein VCUG_02299 [Vavraia culicis subsp. floridensis]|uniref:Uncharacterized protein n=1 Tax=Vavraia culicis (isolate floridensis) TaxID=948595 RepID=L2GSE4_VAVCU|nr:uncharacterized protein VCUG_02299 [Vavraia culicis subsp. floridensis]ELA46218.1 hypothetical protein VCUG_02299 [Vavraia culicis subsp. floridensis]